MIIDNQEYNNFHIRSVKLNLDTCIMDMEVIFTNTSNKLYCVKEYQYKTDCDVNIDEYIKELKDKLNGV